MIGAFARMFASHRPGEEPAAARAGTVREMGLTRSSEVPDPPPEAFVDSVHDEGGTVYVSPILETFRNLFRKERKS
jgi:hypothetical protein